MEERFMEIIRSLDADDPSSYLDPLLFEITKLLTSNLSAHSHSFNMVTPFGTS